MAGRRIVAPTRLLVLHAVISLLNGKAARDFDDQLRRYFGTTELTKVSEAAYEAGLEKIAVDFGLEQDRERRFALWAMMHMLEIAPDLDIAFENPEDREIARNFMDLVAAAGEIDAPGSDR
jgi:hypothetical protein